MTRIVSQNDTTPLLQPMVTIAFDPYIIRSTIMQYTGTDYKWFIRVQRVRILCYEILALPQRYEDITLNKQENRTY